MAPTKRRLLAACGAVVAAMLAAGCVTTKDDTPSGGGIPEEITVLQRSAVEGLEPDVTTARYSSRVSNEIFDGLTRYAWTGSGYKIEGVLAESWAQTAPSTWHVKLRSGVTFSNGEPLNSAAVKFTVDQYLTNKRGGGVAIAGITVVPTNDLEFDIQTSTPNLRTVPDKMTILFPYPPVYYQQVGTAKFGVNPIGTGPYMLERNDPGTQVILKANPTYWGKKPAIKRITFRSVQDDSTRVAELEAGSADFVADVPPSLINRVKGVAGTTTKELTSQRRVYYFFNPHTKPTDDVRVRQAINYAVDKQSIVDGIFGGHATVLKGIWLPGEVGYDASFQGYPYDPDKAKQLLAEAGYPNGLDVDMHYPIGYTINDQQVAEAVQGQLEKVGIHAKMDGGPLKVLSDKLGHNSTGMNMWTFGPYYNHPSFLITTAHFSKNSAYGAYVDDAEMERLGTEGTAAEDPAKTQEIYAQLEKRVIGDLAYWVPLYGVNDVYAMKNSLSGWTPRPDQNFEFSRFGAS